GGALYWRAQALRRVTTLRPPGAGHDGRWRPHAHTSVSAPPVLVRAVSRLVARHPCNERSRRGLPGGGGTIARCDGGHGPAAGACASARVGDRPERAVPPTDRCDGDAGVLWTH